MIFPYTQEGTTCKDVLTLLLKSYSTLNDAHAAKWGYVPRRAAPALWASRLRYLRGVVRARWRYNSLYVLHREDARATVTLPQNHPTALRLTVARQTHSHERCQRRWTLLRLLVYAPANPLPPQQPC